MKAKIRSDLRGYKIPTLCGKYLESDGVTYDTWQPEVLDESEFNTVIINPNTKVTFLVQSIDMEFIHENP